MTVSSRCWRSSGSPNIHLEAAGVAGTTYDVEWVDIADPNPTFPYTPGLPAPTTNNDAISYVGNQGRALGAAHFSRLEGAVYDRGVVYWTSTQGGGVAETGPDTVGGYGNGHGQVWSFDPRAQQLRLVYQSPGPDVLDFPDNVTTSPRGTLILCEDNTNDNYLRGLTRKGELFDVALNRLVSITGRRSLRRRVRRLDLQPRRRDAVRQHPGVARDHLRDLGPLGPHRRLRRPTDRELADQVVGDEERFLRVLRYAQRIVNRRGRRIRPDRRPLHVRLDSRPPPLEAKSGRGRPDLGRKVELVDVEHATVVRLADDRDLDQATAAVGARLELGGSRRRRLGAHGAGELYGTRVRVRRGERRDSAGG